MAESVGLVVAAYQPDDTYGRRLVAAAAAGLGTRREARVLNLPAIGFVPRMSAAERRAYHGDHPIVDPLVGEHAALVQAASALVFVFPTLWWQPPAILKAWLERVLVPGVAFRFDAKGKVRPGMQNIKAIAGVTTYDMDKRSVGQVGDGSRRMLLRAMRANAGRAKTSWSGLFADALARERERFPGIVEKRMAKL